MVNESRRENIVVSEISLISRSDVLKAEMHTVVHLNRDAIILEKVFVEAARSFLPLEEIELSREGYLRATMPRGQEGMSSLKMLAGSWCSKLME